MSATIGVERAPVVTPVTLEGRWVRLEPLSRSHAAGVLAAASKWRPLIVPKPEPTGPTDRARGVVVGCTRLFNIEFWPWPSGNANQRGAERPDVAEIGWTWLAAAAQRTPINTEAKLLMLAHAFDHWRVHRVSLMTDARNQRSRNAILRLGARFDGVLRAARPASDGAIRDTAAFSILEAEWPVVRANLEARLQQ